MNDSDNSEHSDHSEHSEHSDHSVDFEFRHPSEVEFSNPRLSSRRKNIFQNNKQKRRISPTDLQQENIEREIPKKKWCYFY